MELDLKSTLKIIEQQKLRKIEKLREECLSKWEDNKTLNLQELKEFAFSGQAAREILKKHPFSEKEHSIDQIGLAFNILEATRDEIIDQYGIFHASNLYDGFTKINQIEKQITSEVFRFSFCASSLVQAYRRLKSVAPNVSEKLDDITKTIFDDKGSSAFIQGLRNNSAHENIFKVSPTGSIEFDEKKVVRSTIEFDTKELLEKGSWNSEAKAFIEKNDVLNVVDLIDAYFKKSKKLYKSYLGETGLVKEIGFTEMNRCRVAIHTIGNITWLNITLQNAKAKGIEPYSFLGEYFTEAELKRIFCFQANSKDQVNFMINLRDPLKLCDDSLRDKLYEVFDCLD